MANLKEIEEAKLAAKALNEELGYLEDAFTSIGQKIKNNVTDQLEGADKQTQELGNKFSTNLNNAIKQNANSLKEITRLQDQISKGVNVEAKIQKELEGPKGTQTIKELNAIMRSMFKKREVVGISLKLISGQQARYEEINVSESFFQKLENMEGNFNFRVSKIILKLGLKPQSKDQFSTQDTVIFLKDKFKDVAKFQLKGNTTSRLANLKFEGTEIGASAARLGKAPLNLVEKLSTLYDRDLYNSKTKANGNYPTNIIEFKKREKEFKDMFNRDL